MERGNLYMYSGTVSYPDVKIKVLDIAVSLCREGRYAGAGMRWWPVGLHTMVVCDLLPDPLKIHGWMHDSTECVTGDIPKPSKTDEIETFEDELLHKFYAALGLTYPTGREWAQVKQVDKRVLHGEVYTVGTQALQAIYPRDPEAEDVVMKYVNMYTYADCLEAGGRAPIELMKRFRQYKDLITLPKLGEWLPSTQ